MGRRRWAPIALSLIFVSVTATPASAHGGKGTDATNFLSTINGIASAGSAGEAAGQNSLAGLSWRVIGGDVMLEVTNRSSKQLQIPGYSGEPYLRVGPQGVLRNLNSPATYLNAGRFGGDVPQGVSVKAKPKWEKVSDKPVYAWHEHRIHWMSLALPPQVAPDPSVEKVVFDWSVPFSLGEQSMALNGTLKWVPPLEIWPWLLAALVVTSVPVLAGLSIRSQERRRRYLVRSGGAMVFVTAILSVVHSVDDLTAVPASALQNVMASAKVFPFVAAGIFGSVWAWRGKKRPDLGLAIGAVAISMGIGIGHVFALSNSQLSTSLPVIFSRMVFAGAAVVVLPAGLAAWLAYRYQSRGVPGYRARGETAPVPGTGLQQS